MFVKLYKLLFKIKYDFSSIKQKKIVLFDCENTVFLEKLFLKKEYLILTTRYKNLKKIFLNIKLIKTFILRYDKNLNFKQNYLLSIIYLIKPKILITNIDISKDFYRLSRVLHKKIRCISVQWGARGDLFYVSDKDKKEMFIPILFAFGNYEKKIFNLKKISVKKIYSTGSISLLNAYNYINKKKLKRNKYDICLISEPHKEYSSDFSQVKNFADSVGKIAQYTHQICKEENLKLVFSGEGEKKSSNGNNEIKFYEKYLKKFTIKQESRKKFPSYQNIFQSNLVIGHNSTMLRESIGLKKKVLYCNFSGSKLIQAPLPNTIMELNNDTYKMFKKRVLYLLSLQTKDYFDRLNISENYIMTPPKKTYLIVKKLLTKYSK